MQGSGTRLACVAHERELRSGSGPAIEKRPFCAGERRDDCRNAAGLSPDQQSALNQQSALTGKVSCSGRRHGQGCYRFERYDWPRAVPYCKKCQKDPASASSNTSLAQQDAMGSMVANYAGGSEGSLRSEVVLIIALRRASKSACFLETRQYSPRLAVGL